MKQFTFASHEEYLEAQRITTLRRKAANEINPARRRSFTRPEVVEAIRAIQPGPVVLGMCHGVGGGEELDMLAAALGGAWVGTDIVEEMCDGARIVCWDFSAPRPEWVGKFDASFTNALDHAREPMVTLATWFGQLAPGGVLYVCWSRWHNRLSRHPLKRSDCLAADRDEYRGMLAAFGRLRAEVEVFDDKQIQHVVFAAENR